MMKKLVLLAALAAALRLTGLLPFASSDVAELVPVRALVVSVQDGTIVFDGEQCRGMGRTWEQAWEDLEQSANGHVFLGTADHVVLCEDAVEYLSKVVSSRILRPAASICITSGEIPEPKEAADYLDAHDTGVTLQRIKALQLREGNVRLPKLTKTEGGWRLVGAEDR